jgi:acetoin utilization protein AcuB
MDGWMLVGAWMTPRPVAISSETPLIDAHRIMTSNRIRRLPVLRGGGMAGTVTLGDLRGAEPSEACSLNAPELNYLLGQISVAGVLSEPVATVSPSTSIADAAQLMLEERIAGLPVIESGMLVGIKTVSDIVRMVVEAWRRPAPTMPA